MKSSLPLLIRTLLCSPFSIDPIHNMQNTHHIPSPFTSAAAAFGWLLSLYRLPPSSPLSLSLLSLSLPLSLSPLLPPPPFDRVGVASLALRSLSRGSLTQEVLPSSADQSSLNTKPRSE